MISRHVSFGAEVWTVVTVDGRVVRVVVPTNGWEQRSTAEEWIAGYVGLRRVRGMYG